MLTQFLVATNQLFGSRTLGTGKNGTESDIFSKVIMVALG